MAPLRVGIIGFGHLGKFLVEELKKVPEEFSVGKIWNRSSDEPNDVFGLEDIFDADLRKIDLVIEVAHPNIIKQYGEHILQYTNLFVGSPTCFANAELLKNLRNLSKLHHRKLIIPSGAFWGANDIQKMAEIGSLKGLRVSMIKHPTSFKLESPLKELNELAKLEETNATVLFEGPVRDLCPLAPNNVNTMAAGALAAANLGFDGVVARLVSDPMLTDWHIVEVTVQGPDGFEVTTVRKNPAKVGAVTGQLTYFSFLSSVKESRWKPEGVHIC